jgi:hypothetical protein
VLDLAQKLRSAARTGRKLHLEPRHVQVLLSEDVYRVISAMEAQEIRTACELATVNDNDISLETIGSGNARRAVPGASAGSKVVPMDAVSRGASLHLREEAAQLRHRKKR